MENLFARIGINIDFAFVLTFAALIWARMLAMVSTVPFVFGKPVPKMIRVGVSVALTAFLYPLLVPKVPVPITNNLLELFLLFFKEIFFGLVIGFSSAMIFYGFEAAGRMIDNQRGVSLARVLLPELGEQTSLSGQFLFLLAVVVYLSLGGHRLFLNAFIESYQVLPVLSFPQSSNFLSLIDVLGTMTGQILFIAAQISMPVLIAIFIVDIILGVANRLAPQINVWEMGFNIRGYLGVLILYLSLTVIAKQMEHYTFASIPQVENVIQQLKNPAPIAPQELKLEDQPKPLEVPVQSIPSQ